jgi:hypothetical protein
MSKSPLPESLGRFVARQTTGPVADLRDGAREELDFPTNGERPDKSVSSS